MLHHPADGLLTRLLRHAALHHHYPTKILKHSSHQTYRDRKPGWHCSTLRGSTAPCCDSKGLILIPSAGIKNEWPTVIPEVDSSGKYQQSTQKILAPSFGYSRRLFNAFICVRRLITNETEEITDKKVLLVAEYKQSTRQKARRRVHLL